MSGKKKMRTREELLSIPIHEISEDNLPSDEELESLGPLEPMTGTFEEFCAEFLFPNDEKIRKKKKDVIQ